MVAVSKAQLYILRIGVALAVVASASVVDAATASWDPNSEPDLAGYKLSYGTQSGVHTTTIDVGKVTTYPFNPPPGKRYYVVVQAYNTAGALSNKSAEAVIDIPLSNRAPTLTQPGNQSSVLNSNASMALSATDPDGTPLSFSASGLPPGLSLNSASGVIAGIALAKGTYQVTVAASDGALSVGRSFTWTVIDSSSAPIVLDVWPLDTTLTLSHDNNSAAAWLMAYTWPANRVAWAIVMKFSLSQIPANATIQSAALNLSLIVADTNADPNYRMPLHQITGRNPDITRATGMMANGVSTWTANTCCVSGFPMAQADISPARSATTVNRTLGFKVWDATSIARAWLAAPATNYGLLLNADTSKGSDRFRIFGSMQDPAPARRPFLRVTYTVPVSVSSGVTLAALASATPSEDSFVRVTGDFDGDGQGDLTTYRAGEWRIWTSRSSFATPILVEWGQAGDVPVAADYDGDRITDIGIYQPLSGYWEIWLSRAQQPLVVKWGGAANDRPVTVDHDGDGKADLALVRDGTSRILLSSTNFSTSVTVR